MKTLVTHINPHLDDISAIWLFQRFNPEFKDAAIEFISASRDAALKEETEEKIFFGTGGGKYDEHKGDLEDCATSLVWKDLKTKGLVPDDQIFVNALEKIVEWSRLIDLGREPEEEFGSFSVQAFIRPLDSTQDSSLKALDLGKEILDRILEVLKKEEQAKLDWENRIEFETKFGKSYALESETINRPFCKAHGGDLFLMVDPKNHSVQYFTPSFEIDLEPIYTKVKELDPNADWFLHQSHHMVLCGAGASPEFKPTKLSFEQLIEAAKQV